MLPCCKKARLAIQNAIKNKENWKEVVKKWNQYQKEATPWTECRAYRKSKECIEEMRTKLSCPCPPGGDFSCCAQLESSYYKVVIPFEEVYCDMVIKLGFDFSTNE